MTRAIFTSCLFFISALNLSAHGSDFGSLLTWLRPGMEQSAHGRQIISQYGGRVSPGWPKRMAEAFALPQNRYFGQQLRIRLEWIAGQVAVRQRFNQLLHLPSFQVEAIDRVLTASFADNNWAPPSDRVLDCPTQLGQLAELNAGALEARAKQWRRYLRNPKSGEYPEGSYTYLGNTRAFISETLVVLNTEGEPQFYFPPQGEVFRFVHADTQRNRLFLGFEDRIYHERTGWSDSFGMAVIESDGRLTHRVATLSEDAVENWTITPSGAIVIANSGRVYLQESVDEIVVLHRTPGVILRHRPRRSKAQFLFRPTVLPQGRVAVVRGFQADALAKDGRRAGGEAWFFEANGDYIDTDTPKKWGRFAGPIQVIDGEVTLVSESYFKGESSSLVRSAFGFLVMGPLGVKLGEFKAVNYKPVRYRYSVDEKKVRRIEDS